MTEFEIKDYIQVSCDKCGKFYATMRLVLVKGEKLDLSFKCQCGKRNRIQI